MADKPTEPEPTPVVDRTPLGATFLRGMIAAAGFLLVMGSAKLIGRAFRNDLKALGEGE